MMASSVFMPKCPGKKMEIGINSTVSVPKRKLDLLWLKNKKKSQEVLCLHFPVLWQSALWNKLYCSIRAWYEIGFVPACLNIWKNLVLQIYETTHWEVCQTWKIWESKLYSPPEHLIPALQEVGHDILFCVKQQIFLCNFFVGRYCFQMWPHPQSAKTDLSKMGSKVLDENKQPLSEDRHFKRWVQPEQIPSLFCLLEHAGSK